MSGRSPYTFHLTATVPGVATAGTDQQVIIGESPDAGTVTEVSILPNGTVAASGSLFRTWTLYNRGSGGAGVVVVATMDTSTLPLTDNDERLMTLSGTAANLGVALDDVLEIVETHASTGTIHTGYRVDLSIART
jgi:hypothetical protein